MMTRQEVGERLLSLPRKKKNIDNKTNAEKTFNRLLCVFRWKAYIALSPIVLLLDSCAAKSVKWILVYSVNNGADFICKYAVVYYYFVFVNTIRLFTAPIKCICNITLLRKNCDQFLTVIRLLSSCLGPTSGPTSSQYRQGSEPDHLLRIMFLLSEKLQYDQCV